MGSGIVWEYEVDFNLNPSLPNLFKDWPWNP